ncbi:MAG: hypothetical protein IKV48_06950 [Eggerthellaceae bacterium]|nr:hypothetical protein [Eggerthellaceae bacterium]
MNYSASCNIFEVTANDTLELYGDFVEGDGRKLVLILGSEPKGLSSHAKSALGNSMSKLGYGHDCCSFATTSTLDGGQLGPHDAFTLIEGLDPLLVIAADAHAANIISQAYRTPITLDDIARPLGRPCLAFSSFEHMLESEDGKQRAWALMKKVAR